jgi:hypothetical protein
MKYIAIILLLTLTGCTTIDHVAVDGSWTRYVRFGSQELSNVSMVLPDGSGLEFERQKSDPSETIKAITNLVKSIK